MVSYNGPSFEEWQKMIFGYVADPDGAHTQKDFAVDGLLIKNTAAAYGLRTPRRGSALRAALDEVVTSMTPDRRIGDITVNNTIEVAGGER